MIASFFDDAYTSVWRKRDLLLAMAKEPMFTPQIVIDTNVIMAGLRSKRGAAFRLLSLVGTGLFDIHLSVPLVLEYEEVLFRIGHPISLRDHPLYFLSSFHNSLT